MMMTCEGTDNVTRWGGGDDGGNINKFRGNILSIPPLCALIASLFEMTTGSQFES